MNKKYNQFVPIIFIIAAIIFIAILVLIVNPTWKDYNDTKNSSKKAAQELKNYKERYEKEKEKISQEEIQLQSIKQIYQTNLKDTDNLSVYGTMFDDIIQYAKNNGLFIRSIEYNMKPEYNDVYNNFSEKYNVCELKFFFVGTYSQLKTFLNELNTRFKYLVSISKLSVTVFEGNTDYLLIHTSITLYSKKPSEHEE